MSAFAKRLWPVRSMQPQPASVVSPARPARPAACATAVARVQSPGIPILSPRPPAAVDTAGGTDAAELTADPRAATALAEARSLLLLAEAWGLGGVELPARADDSPGYSVLAMSESCSAVLAASFEIEPSLAMALNWLRYVHQILELKSAWKSSCQDASALLLLPLSAVVALDGGRAIDIPSEPSIDDRDTLGEGVCSARDPAPVCIRLTLLP